MTLSVKKRQKLTGHKFESAEFKLGNMNIIYQFKLRRDQEDSLFAIVGKNSSLLEALRPGDVIPMQYYGPDRSQPAEALNTKIKHITRNCPGKFNGHVMIGLETGGQSDDITGG